MAWDEFVRRCIKEPESMWFAHLTYPCWVAQYGDSHEEIDNIELLSERRSDRTK